MILNDIIYYLRNALVGTDSKDYTVDGNLYINKNTVTTNNNYAITKSELDAAIPTVPTTLSWVAGEQKSMSTSTSSATYSYTAPSTGICVVDTNPNASTNTYVNVENAAGTRLLRIAPSAGAREAQVFPMNKGEVYKITYAYCAITIKPFELSLE